MRLLSDPTVQKESDGIARLQEETEEASVAPPSVGVRSAWSGARMSSVVELDPRLYQPS
jgi:hypothetical protein